MMNEPEETAQARLPDAEECARLGQLLRIAFEAPSSGSFAGLMSKLTEAPSDWRSRGRNGEEASASGQAPRRF